MNDRKKTTAVLEKILQEKTLSSKNHSSPTLTHTPSDVKTVISDFLANNQIRLVAELSKEFYRFVKSNRVKTTSFYYAVGSNINLYDYHYQYSTVHLSRKLHFSENEIMQSLDKNSLLFSDYSTAKNYAYLSESTFHDRSLDLFIPKAVPGVFIVQLFQDSPYTKKTITVQVREDIPDCPAPPSAKEMQVTAFKTSSNIKIHFAKFDGRLFEYKTESRFTEIWAKAVSHHEDSTQAAIAGISALFKSGFSWYSEWTLNKKTKELFKNMIAKTQQKPSLEELHEYVNRSYQSAITDTTVDPQGDYVQMLRFTQVQLNILRGIKPLPEIKDYMRKDTQKGYH